MNHKLVALLPMKQQSVRVPGKNFRPLAGKPLARWILDTLLSLDEIELVVINTDARSELKKIGIETSDRIVIRDRKQDLCGNEVSMNRILADDISAIASETYLMTHTTNPFLSSGTITSALASFNDSACDSLFTVNKHQTRFYRKDGSPINHDPANLVPTQDLEPWYEENSNLYLFTRESFAATEARIGNNPHLFVSPLRETIDIDTEEDWSIAELAASSLVRESH